MKSIAPENAHSRSRGRDDVVFSIIMHTVLVIFSLFFLLPFLNVISLSFSESYHVLKGDVLFWPKGFSLLAYQEVFADNKVLPALGNTVLLATAGCLLSMLATAMAAYPIVFTDAPGKKLYSAMIMITHFFSAGIVPTFITVTGYGLLNSYWALILLALVSAYNVLVVKAFYASLPMSLVESARIDGANDFKILFRIVIPLAKPVLATIAMWIIVGHWNDYLTVSIYIKNESRYTLQLVLKEMLKTKLLNYETTAQSAENMLQNQGLSEQLKYVACIISMLPMLAIYPFFQRFFVKGVMIGAVKG